MTPFAALLALAVMFNGWDVDVSPAEVAVVNPDGSEVVYQVYTVVASEQECHHTYTANVPRQPYVLQMVLYDLAIVSEGGIVTRFGSCRQWNSPVIFADGFERGSTAGWSFSSGLASSGRLR